MAAREVTITAYFDDEEGDLDSTEVVQALMRIGFYDIDVEEEDDL